MNSSGFLFVRGTISLELTVCKSKMFVQLFLGSGFELTVNPTSDKGSITEEMLPHIKNTVPNALKLPKRHNKDDSARFMLPLLKGQIFL